MQALGLGRAAAREAGRGRPGGRWLIFTPCQCVPSPQSGTPASRPVPAPARSPRAGIPGMGSSVGISRAGQVWGARGGILMFILVTEAPRPGRLQARWAQASVRGVHVASSKGVLAEGAEGGNPGGSPREAHLGQRPQQCPWSSEGVQEGGGHKAQGG